MTFLVSGVLGTLYFCLDNDNLLFWSREKGGSSEPNELPLDPPLTCMVLAATVGPLTTIIGPYVWYWLLL